MDFLFEIGLEELPSRYVDETEANLKKIMTEKLTDERISFSDIESFSTPRRVAVIVKNIAEKQCRSFNRHCLQGRKTYKSRRRIYKIPECV